MTAFNAGDIVVLKSNGPKMTVSHTSENGEVVCHWFNPDIKEHVEEVFLIEQLQRADALGS